MSSTSGYLMEIAVLQCLQRPRSHSQLSTGMLCQGLMGDAQFGHCEPGDERLIFGSLGVG